MKSHNFFREICMKSHNFALSLCDSNIKSVSIREICVPLFTPQTTLIFTNSIFRASKVKH